MTTLSTLYQLYLEHPIVCTDTRKLSVGCIFFALKGANFDGNRYAQQALASGAAYAVIDDPTQQLDERCLLVPEVLSCLQALARLHRQQLATPILAITGTNGKTTTKELCAAVLSSQWSILYTEGNLNNQIGVPLTLLRLQREHRFAIIEMGASHPGDIAELCAIAEPDYGLITNIGAAHLEGFGSLEGVRRTKGELYDYLRSKGGQVFVHADDPMLLEMSQGMKRSLYSSTGQSATLGLSSSTEVVGRAASSPSLFLSLDYQLATEDQQRHLATQLVGAYNLPNVLAALCVGHSLGIASEHMQTALSSYKPSNSRSQLIETARGNQLIADAYNANPSSMAIAVENFRHSTSPLAGRCLILGDMNELGAASEEAHHQLRLQLEVLLREQPSCRIYLCGPCWERELAKQPSTQLQSFASASALAAFIEQHPLTQSLILLKGSNGIGLGKLIEYL